MSDRFHELSLKACANECSEAEQAELDALLASAPGLRAELEQMRADVRLAKDILPLAEAVHAPPEDIPAYARERLQSKVRKTLGRQVDNIPRPGLLCGWRWLLGLAATVAVAALIAVPLLLTPPKAQIQVAFLDLAGPTRGAETNDLGALLGEWRGATLTNVSSLDELKSWQQAWTPPESGYQVKIIYDRAAAEIRVLGKGRGREFTNYFTVGPDPRPTLDEVQVYVKRETAK